jgi:hypothetical protein
LTVVFPVLPSHYYKLTKSSGSPTIDKFYEYTWSAVSATRSATLTARPATTTSTTTSRTYVNTSGATVFAMVTVHNNATGSGVALHERSGYQGFSNMTQPAKAFMSMSSLTAHNRLVATWENPFEFYTVYQDTGSGPVNDFWFEWKIQ